MTFVINAWTQVIYRGETYVSFCLFYRQTGIHSTNLASDCPRNLMLSGDGMNNRFTGHIFEAASVPSEVDVESLAKLYPVIHVHDSTLSASTVCKSSFYMTQDDPSRASSCCCSLAG